MNFQLPDLSSQTPLTNEIENLLNRLKDEVEIKYNEDITILVTTSSTINENIESVLSYAVYLVFTGRNNFSYRLFEINCKKADGGFPVEVNAFVGPSIHIGDAETKSDLEERINEILKHDRTRNLILTYYRL